MAISVHKPGVKYARSLIEHGKVSEKPFSLDGADKEEMLGPKGSDTDHYGAHHLGKDESAEGDDHRGYRYAHGKHGMVYTRALESACSRAETHGHDEIRSAAQGLIDMIGEANRSKPAEAETPVVEASEVRCVMYGLELRNLTSGDGSPGTVVGYAAVFDRFSQDLGHFREKIAPGAFSGCMLQDVRALANHDPKCLLGRSTAGTLRMREDRLGLRVEIDLPDTQAGNDTAKSIKRGDMDGMSFAFDTEVDQWDYSGEVPVRTLIKVRNLYDVGPVTYPAYTDTSAALRSLERGRPADTRPAPVRSYRRHISIARARLQLAEALISKDT